MKCSVIIELYIIYKSGFLSLFCPYLITCLLMSDFPVFSGAQYVNLRERWRGARNNNNSISTILLIVSFMWVFSPLAVCKYYSGCICNISVNTHCCVFWSDEQDSVWAHWDRQVDITTVVASFSDIWRAERTVMRASLDNTFVVIWNLYGFYLLGNTKEQNCQAVFFCTMQEDGDRGFHCTFFL